MLSREFLETLHRRMYADVWTWAGKQRTDETNIGVVFTNIGVELRILFDDPRRDRYIQALQAADHHDYGTLIAFARGEG